MAKKNKIPKLGGTPSAGLPKAGAEPESYKTKNPVWRFSSFDWDGTWGILACADKNWRKHIQSHLAAFETMTWAQIELTGGGRSHGTNSHYLPRSKLTKVARDRLEERKIYGDNFFSLRLENTVRIYGIREDNCLRIIWFDPFHFQGNDQAVYSWS